MILLDSQVLPPLDVEETVSMTTHERRKKKKRLTFQRCPSFQVRQNNLHEKSALTGSVHYSKIYNIASEKRTTAF